MKVIRFWIDIGHGRNGARPIAWFTVAVVAAAVVVRAFEVWN